MPLSPHRGRVGLTRRLTAVFALAVGFVGFSPILSQTSDATVGVDDYPPRLKAAALDALVDPWNFYNRECTSFVAWRLNNDGGRRLPQLLPGACTGATRPTGGTPLTRSASPSTPPRPSVPVAWWAAGSAGSSRGHVAWVAARTSSSITIEEYNYLSGGPLRPAHDLDLVQLRGAVRHSSTSVARRSPNTSAAVDRRRGTVRWGQRLMARPGGAGTRRSRRSPTSGSPTASPSGMRPTAAFAPRPAQLGKRLQVRVTARYGSSGPSEPPPPTAARWRRDRSSRPSGRLHGTAQVGEPLAANRGRWAPAGATFSFQWLANGDPVPGATSRKFARAPSSSPSRSRCASPPRAMR